MVFFDSEAAVEIGITDEEIYRTEQNEKVQKEHIPYMGVATYYTDTGKGTPSEVTREYIANEIYGKTYPAGTATFLDELWGDIDKYTRTNEKVYVFAHNAKYDVQVTGGVTLLIGMGYRVIGFSDDNPFILELEKYITHSPRTKLEYGTISDQAPDPEHEYPEHKKPRETLPGVWFYPAPKVKSIIILSSTNYYQQSLASLGKVFGLEKLEFDHAAEFDLETALIYCRRDVAILKKAMLGFIHFIEREQLGSFSVTVAGQAFGAFRHRFLKEDTVYIHADKRALRVERDAYAGGRTECFYMGEVRDRVYYVDVNSMYPYVMANKLYPVELVTFWESATVAQVREKIMDDYLICCDARVNTENPIYHKKQKRLLFPVGDFWTSLSTPELIRAINDGSLIEVKNVAIYKPGNLFDGYVNYFYEKRLLAKKNKDAVHDLLYKLFPNSLYGKFGQRNYRWEAVGEAPPDKIDYIQIYHADTKERETFKVFGGSIWKKKDDEDAQEAYNSSPAIAAHVTAYARMLLWESIEVAGRENVYYSDTDSLFCNAEGYQYLWLENLLDNSILGKLKLEDFGRLELFGCKDYIFESETKKDKEGKNIKSIKIKGISRTAKSLPASSSGRLRFAVTQWGGFSDRLRDKNFTKYYNKVIIKELKREYNKGNVDGNTVTPYRFDTVQEEIDRAAQEEIEYKEYLNKSAQDVFDKDYILTLCKAVGFIKVIQKGESYYSEYIKISNKNKMKYFRHSRGLPLDVWCQATGKEVNPFIDELIYYK